MENLKNDFDKIYMEYYPKMYGFAKEYVASKADAENLVQDVFLRLWEKREVLQIEVNLSNYLFTLIRNRCLDYLRHLTIVNHYKAEYKIKLASLETLNHVISPDYDLESLIESAIQKLPEQCRIIFFKNRVEGKKYAEIAVEMNLSVNTVRNQVSIALKKLRTELRDYLGCVTSCIKPPL